MDYHDLHTPIQNAAFMSHVSDSLRPALVDAFSIISEDRAVSSKEVSSPDTGALVIRRDTGNKPYAELHDARRLDSTGKHCEVLLFSWAELEWVVSRQVGHAQSVHDLLLKNTRITETT